jgi:hypothetical protein
VIEVLKTKPVQKEAGKKKELLNMSNSFKKATAGFEPAIRVLQTPALPLGYVAKACSNAANRIRGAAECQIPSHSGTFQC